MKHEKKKETERKEKQPLLLRQIVIYILLRLSFKTEARFVHLFTFLLLLSFSCYNNNNDDNNKMQE